MFAPIQGKNLLAVHYAGNVSGRKPTWLNITKLMLQNNHRQGALVSEEEVVEEFYPR
jgi:hypothetical protein